MQKKSRNTAKVSKGEMFRPFVATVQKSGFSRLMERTDTLASIEICAGFGGQALGLSMAGFCHAALVEYEKDYCLSLMNNRPEWNVVCDDVCNFSGKKYRGEIDLLAGGVPCPPFSVAGKQLGKEDERNLFPEAIRLIGEIRPRAVMLENVRGLLDPVFADYLESILADIRSLGYSVHIKLLNASDYGVPQLRPRVIIVAIRNDIEDTFEFPEPKRGKTKTVGETLFDLMAENGWKGARDWADRAAKIAPTVVGGSKKHGGPDLGPTRARKAWAELGVDGVGIANSAPTEDFEGQPRLTPRMLARIQGFPDDWKIIEKKTAACRMIGNAFPPPVAQAVGEQIAKVLKMTDSKALIAAERKKYHEFLLSSGVLSIDKDGVASNADKSSRLSKEISKHIADSLMAETKVKMVGQSAGADFEKANMQFLEATFPALQNIRPGSWHIVKLGNRNAIKTSSFAQYEHLEYLAELTSENKRLATCVGNDYMVAPDVVIYRDPVSDEEINTPMTMVNQTVCLNSDIRQRDGALPILHASISAKWTMRSDRAQNSRTEALGLIRNRKGHLPHIVVVTGEPLPSRLASLALGTGDIDCMYHFALYELVEAVRQTGAEDSIEMLKTLIDGKRLKDISDLPLDLAV